MAVGAIAVSRMLDLGTLYTTCRRRQFCPDLCVVQARASSSLRPRVEYMRVPEWDCTEQLEGVIMTQLVVDVVGFSSPDFRDTG